MARTLLSLSIFLTLSAPALARTLVVLSGGYQTCLQENEVFRPGYVPDVFHIVNPAKAFLDNLKAEDGDLDVIWSCYSGILNKKSAKRIASDGPMTFQYGRFGVSEKPGRAQFDAIDLDDGKPLLPFFDYVRAHIAKTSPRRIYLVGHSYGGWTMLQLGARLTEDGTDLSGVLLVDAISPFQCPANVMVSSLLFLFQTTPGCLKAPRDILVHKMENLAHRSGWLRNVYQTRFPFLHSGKMSYAGWKNQEITTFPKYVPFGDYHTFLAVDPRVWASAPSGN